MDNCDNYILGKWVYNRLLNCAFIDLGVKLEAIRLQRRRILQYETNKWTQAVRCHVIHVILVRLCYTVTFKKLIEYDKLYIYVCMKECSVKNANHAIWNILKYFQIRGIRNNWREAEVYTNTNSGLLTSSKVVFTFSYSSISTKVHTLTVSLKYKIKVLL